ncbi:MAG: cytochrome c4 [Rubrivivax sp.]|nr:cytochrome c4 [Rubrivivax sp.]
MKSATSSLVALLLATLISAVSVAPAMAAESKPAAKPDLVKGQATAATCMACHTADGSRGAPANPILQGQHAEYLAKQLHEFKAGKRKNAIMQGMAAALSEDDIRNVAAFYASKEPKAGAAKNKATVLQGEKIWRAGIADRKIAACAGCHGPNGAGIPAQYPKLSGQHADYTEAQLLAFRSGLRANNVQMTGVAAKMNDAEIKAVSDYVAGLR